MKDSAARELDWLKAEVALSERLDDAGRVAVMEDLLRAARAIAAGKTADELRRDEEARRVLEDAPGKARYRALIERLEAAAPSAR